MKPKHKAKQLIIIYSDTILNESGGNKLTMDQVKQIAKQCSLVSVYEILINLETQSAYCLDVAKELEAL
jgi:hypothetical protein